MIWYRAALVLLAAAVLLLLALMWWFRPLPASDPGCSHTVPRACSEHGSCVYDRERCEWVEITP